MIRTHKMPSMVLFAQPQVDKKAFLLIVSLSFFIEGISIARSPEYPRQPSWYCSADFKKFSKIASQYPAAFNDLDWSTTDEGLTTTVTRTNVQCADTVLWHEITEYLDISYGHSDSDTADKSKRYWMLDVYPDIYSTGKETAYFIWLRMYEGGKASSDKAECVITYRNDIIGLRNFTGMVLFRQSNSGKLGNLQVWQEWPIPMGNDYSVELLMYCYDGCFITLLSHPVEKKES